jgi:hypothetical protein
MVEKKEDNNEEPITLEFLLEENKEPTTQEIKGNKKFQVLPPEQKGGLKMLT